MPCNALVELPWENNTDALKAGGLCVGLCLCLCRRSCVCLCPCVRCCSLLSSPFALFMSVLHISFLCDCACVCEREREGERQRKRQRDRECAREKECVCESIGYIDRCIVCAYLLMDINIHRYIDT